MRVLGVWLVVSAFCSSCDGPSAIIQPSSTEESSPSLDANAPHRATANDSTGSIDLSATPVGTGTAALDGLAWSERVALEQALAANDARYAPRADDTGTVLEAPGSVRATFTASGAHLSFCAREATLGVTALGREGAMRPAPVGEPAEVRGAEVRIARGAGITEWWRSLPSGLEHGVTIAARPAGEGELWIEVAVTGELSAHSLSDDAVELRDMAGAHVATYAHLVVLDATGERVPARMSMAGERIALVIDDSTARYPVVIDPLVTAQEAALLATDGAASDSLGYSVALTSDGSRALVGALYDDTAGGATGSARVFLRTGTTWVQEATLLAPDGAPVDSFGFSVALASDGSRALVGAYRDDTLGGLDAGSARVFLRIDTSWVFEATLLAPDGAAGDNFGFSVALTSDGDRALVGANSDDTAGGVNAGSGHVFLRSGTTWVHEATLLALDGAADDYFGQSVALTSDGSRALVGAPNDDTTGGLDAGSAGVFLRTGTTWAQQATLLAPDGPADDYFGYSVALASDGSRAVVGAPGDDTVGGTNAGSARVFQRTGSSWIQEATLLEPDGVAFEYFGSSVAVTSDGSRVLVGSPLDDTMGVLGVDAGSVRVFVRGGTAWVQEARLVAPDGADEDSFGYSVALTSDGSRALVGSPFDDTSGGTNAGSARAFIIVSTNGSRCTGDTQCASGFCTDGVCCSTRCSAGALDCEACSAALTGGDDGTCAPLSAALSPTVTCRPSTDLCDPAETCRSTSTACPTDVLAAASTVCRPSTDPCDVAELCSGSSPECPADAVVPAGAVCRVPAGPCDAEEVCDGTSPACPVDGARPPGTTCRASAGACDTAEVCDGVAVACPGDTLLPSGSVCRASAGLCDLTETCTGTSPICPGDVLAAPGLVCRAPVAGGCDVAETCTGLAAACPDDLFAPPTTVCGPAVSGVCDAPDHCTGTSADCASVFLEGVECRPAAGACDSPERCGSATDCPADDLVSGGLSCRASTDSSCDVEEVCDGVSPMCPADVTACMVRPDAGVGADAAGHPSPATGCGCAVDSPRTNALPWALSMGLLAVLILQRRPSRARAARRR